MYYRHGTPKLSGIVPKLSGVAQKEEKINALLEYCNKPRDRDEIMKFLGIKQIL